MKSLIFSLFLFVPLHACDSATDTDEDPRVAACEVSCAKACKCGTNLCGDGPGGANNGCVRVCAGQNGGRGDTDAYNQCMASASCEEVTAGQCLALNQ